MFARSGALRLRPGPNPAGTPLRVPSLSVTSGIPAFCLDKCTSFVYTIAMIKNITLTADEALIEQARRQATIRNTTLNELFRTWLARYVAQPAAADQYEALMTRLGHVKAGRKFTREEMNERR